MKMESMDIMMDDMTYTDTYEVFEDDTLFYPEETIESQGMSNNMVLTLVIGGCVIVGIVLGIILGRKAARK